MSFATATSPVNHLSSPLRSLNHDMTCNNRLNDEHRAIESQPVPLWRLRLLLYSVTGESAKPRRTLHGQLADNKSIVCPPTNESSLSKVQAMLMQDAYPQSQPCRSQVLICMKSISFPDLGNTCPFIYILSLMFWSPLCHPEAFSNLLPFLEGIN